MWCEQCQQDVPAVASAHGGKLRCPRCARQVYTVSGACSDSAASQGGRPAGAKQNSDTSECDPWESDQRLRDIGQVLGAVKPEGQPSKPAYKREAARLDLPYHGPSPWHVSPGAGSRNVQRRGKRTRPLLGAITWITLALGTMALVCGGVLLGWSVVSGRDELWSVGVPVALGGQIALILVLILQLDRLWHDSRSATSQLQKVDKQLHELKTTTNLLGSSYTSPANAFYSHLAGGAGPQLLLHDLKGQLDLLALKIGQQESRASSDQ